MQYVAQWRTAQGSRESGFAVFLTTDKNISHQQNLGVLKIAVVALGRNRWSLIQPMLGRIREAVESAKPGTYTLVDIPGQ